MENLIICSQCSYVYTTLQIALAKPLLIGFREDNGKPACNRCKPKEIKLILKNSIIGNSDE